MTAEIVPLSSRTFCARLERFGISGLSVNVAGTLDGFIDLAITPPNGAGLTYSLTCDDARRLIAALHAVVADIRTNCLYERDALLGGL